VKIVKVTTNIQDILDEESIIEAKPYIIGNGEEFFKTLGNVTLEGLNHQQPTWNAEDMAYGLNRLIEVAKSTEKYLYRVYSWEEIEKDPDKKDVHLFHFPGSKEGSFVIIAAGGGYSGVCSLAEAFPTAAKFNELGITAFCLNYRTGQVGLLPKPIDDLAAGYRLITKHAKQFQVNPNRYAVCGFSAGGHLTAEWGTKQLGYVKYHLNAPEMLMLVYPFITTEKVSEENRDLFFTGMFGHGYTTEAMNSYNVNHHIDADYPPVYIVHSQDDELVTHSLCLADALKKAQISYKIELPEMGGHGFGLGTFTPAAGWIERAMEFWTKIRKMNKKEKK